MIYGTHCKHDQSKHGAAYRTFDDLEAAVRCANVELREYADDFDALVVTGMSGMAVGFPLALRLRKPIMVCRKPDDDCHQSGGCVVGMTRAQARFARLLWVDDFISSGDTLERVKYTVDSFEPTARIVGHYLYQGEYGEGQNTIIRWGVDDEWLQVR